MLTKEKLDELKKLRDICSELLEAHNIISQPEPVQPDLIDIDKWKISQRNMILAGSGVKAELFGTLSTEPTIVEKDLTDLDVYPSMAAEIISVANEIRTKALSYEETVPKEILK